MIKAYCPKINNELWIYYCAKTKREVREDLNTQTDIKKYKIVPVKITECRVKK